MEVTGSETTAQIEKYLRVPPFKIIPTDNWKNLILRIKRVIPTATSKLKRKFLNIKVETPVDYRLVQKFLITLKIKFQSYLLENAKTLRVIFRELLINTAEQEIQECLELDDFTDVKVTQMYRKPLSNKHFMPLFYVSLPMQADVDCIYQATEIVNTEGRLKKHREQKGLSQYHNSQGFFHSSQACNLPPLQIIP